MDINEISAITKNYQTARSTMTRLVKKGYALRPHQGIYAAVPLEMTDAYHVNRYILAHKVAHAEGALCLHSALELLGVAQSYFNTAFCFTARPRRGFKFQGIDYKFMTTEHMFGMQEMMTEGVKIRVTDRERTFIDCIRNIELCGGLEETLKSLGGFHTIDTKVLGGYLKAFSERSLNQRTGYVLTLLREPLRISEEFLEALKMSCGKRTYYLTPGTNPVKSRLDTQWNVMVPKNIEEVLRFA